MEGFDPERTPEVFRREEVTLAGSGTAFHLAYLQAQRKHPSEPLFAKLKACVGGGAPKPAQLHYDVKAELGGAGILSGWGLTEAPILSMATASDGDDALAATEGKAMPGVELRVVTLDGRPAGVGEEGELRARAPQLMKGYLDASLDVEAFDEHGFLRTGDLGTIDADGNVAITGRLKDIIIRHGENISAREVEDLLYAHPSAAAPVELAVLVADKALPDADPSTLPPPPEPPTVLVDAHGGSRRHGGPLVDQLPQGSGRTKGRSARSHSPVLGQRHLLRPSAAT